MQPLNSHFIKLQMDGITTLILSEKETSMFLSLQEKFTYFAEKSKAEYYLIDGVHPHIAGASLIADEWVRLFQGEVNKSCKENFIKRN